MRSRDSTLRRIAERDADDGLTGPFYLVWRRKEIVRPHLSRDKAAAKMGHPVSYSG
jgi:hypothetical protein